MGKDIDVSAFAITPAKIGIPYNAAVSTSLHGPDIQ